jgi:hypothetical protein
VSTSITKRKKEEEGWDKQTMDFFFHSRQKTMAFNSLLMETTTFRGCVQVGQGMLFRVAMQWAQNQWPQGPPIQEGSLLLHLQHFGNVWREVVGHSLPAVSFRRGGLDDSKMGTLEEVTTGADGTGTLEEMTTGADGMGARAGLVFGAGMTMRLG